MVILIWDNSGNNAIQLSVKMTSEGQERGLNTATTVNFATATVIETKMVMEHGLNLACAK
jgi:hypothetical protein